MMANNTKARRHSLGGRGGFGKKSSHPESFSPERCRVNDFFATIRRFLGWEAGGRRARKSMDWGLER